MTIRIRREHAWDVSPKEAMALQERMRRYVIDEDRLRGVTRVAGVDVGFEDGNRVTRAAVAVLDARTLELVDSAVFRSPTRFPYVPGLLSFRETPAVLEALQALRSAPHLILCDAQGYAHPRRFGLACHLGVLTGVPTIGVAKSRLIGEHAEVPRARGSSRPLLHEGERIGIVLRTRAGVKPLYVSIGHRVSLETAVEWVLRLAPRYRLPETTRWAHRLASRE